MSHKGHRLLGACWLLLGVGCGAEQAASPSDIADPAGPTALPVAGAPAPATPTPDLAEPAAAPADTAAPNQDGAPAAPASLPASSTVPSSEPGAEPGAEDPTTQAAEPAAPVAGSFPPVDARWAEPGPFEVVVEPGGPDHTLYYPVDLGRDGLLHPVVLWGNGTGATPIAYDGLLRHWASHGFIVAAANTVNAGSGREMLAGATWLAEEHVRDGSAFFGAVDLTAIAASGHSQGGGGAIAAGADPSVGVTVPIQPGPQGLISALHGPMFILGGSADFIVNPALLVEPRYRSASHIEAVYGLLQGAGHFEPVGDGGAMRGYMTAWLRLHLMGDESARGEFYGADCGLCTDPAWTVETNF